MNYKEKFKKAIDDVYKELSSIDKKELNEMIEKHEPTDFYDIILDTFNTILIQQKEIKKLKSDLQMAENAILESEGW